MKLLFVDDKTLTSNLDRVGFKKLGVGIETATNYDEVLKQVRKIKIDVIVINFDFKRDDSFELIRELKRVSLTKNIPIALTGVDISEKVRRTAAECHADLIVEQPIPRDYFLQELKSLLDGNVRRNQRTTATPIGKVTFTLSKKKSSFAISDISVGGLLVKTGESLPLNSQLELKVHLDSIAEPLGIWGEVVRVLEKDGEIEGIGIRFTKFQNDAKNSLKSFISDHELDDPRMKFYL